LLEKTSTALGLRFEWLPTHGHACGLAVAQQLAIFAFVTVIFTQ